MAIFLKTMIVFMGTVLLITGSALEAQSSEEWITQGNVYHNQFDTYNAFKAYKAAFDTDSTNYDAIWKMAAELIDMGNELPKSSDQIQKYTEAMEIAGKAVQLNPNNSKAHLILAMAYEKMALDKTGSDRIKILNQSRMATEKALGINPNEDMGYCLLGRWNRTMTNIGWMVRTYSNLFVVSTPSASYDAALEQFMKAVAINPDNISHYMELGKTYALLEKWEPAGEAFEKTQALPITQKSDSKSQREAKHYLQLMQQGHYSELTDLIEE